MKSFQLPFMKSKKNGKGNNAPKPNKPPPDLGFKTFHRNYISGVEVDSPTRTPPRAHPETRKSLRMRIATWLQDESDTFGGSFYVTGPTCVGKTAVMQTIVEGCQQADQIGASLFLSHINRLDDNSRIISTISSQIAKKNPPFMKTIFETLENNPRLFERDHTWQFFKLIIEPSRVLRPRVSLKKQKPIVIVIDGLDQCGNTSSQFELLQLIDNFTRRGDHRCPFKWLICGRPVSRWMKIISQPKNHHAHLLLHDPESVEDVYKHIIFPGFRDIRKQYPASFDGDEEISEEWPTQAQLRKVAEASSGFFMFASNILQFIADQQYQDPKGQLQRCLQFIDDSSQPRNNNPLSPLYLVYQQILSDIDPDVLSETMRILQLLAGQSADNKFGVQHIADSLNMDLSALYRALDGLCSVLKFSLDEPQQQTMEFYHSSFVNFLRYQVDPSRNKSLSHIQEVVSSRSHYHDSDLAFSILLPLALVEAEFDSPARYPLPKCQMGTRALLRQKISIWFTDSDRTEHILWITGPVGAGKSALAQVLARFCHQTSRLGASLFIPHFQQGTAVDYAQRVIPTLACQLAAQSSEYQTLLADSLIRDPSVLERDLRSQFLEFIAQPLEELQKNHHLYSPCNPLVIVLDGLDACGNKTAQIELMRLISEFSKHSCASPGLLWVICSRPESHIKKIIWRMTVQSICRHEELLIDDIEAREDVERVLRDGFFEIRKRYFFRFGPTETWPGDFHWPILMHASSGFFKYALCILEYVADEDQRDPRALLEVCSGLVHSSLVPHALHPFRSLDALYEQVMLSVPPDHLSIALRALSLCVHVSTDGLFVRDILPVLHVERSTLNTALENLHSVINITSLGNDDEKIGFYHHSFCDFLKDPKRSGQIAHRINMDFVDPTPEPQPRASGSKNPDGKRNPSYSHAGPSVASSSRG